MAYRVHGVRGNLQLLTLIPVAGKEEVELKVRAS